MFCVRGCLQLVNDASNDSCFRAIIRLPPTQFPDTNAFQVVLGKGNRKSFLMKAHRRWLNEALCHFSFWLPELKKKRISNAAINNRKIRKTISRVNAKNNEDFFRPPISRKQKILNRKRKKRKKATGRERNDWINRQERSEEGNSK